MGVNLAQGTIVAQFGQLLGGQGLQLVFRNREIFGDLLRLASGAVRIARGKDSFARVQQVELLQQGQEGVCTQTLLLEIVAELHRLLGVGRRLAVDEQRRGTAFLDERCRAVNAQDHAALRIIVGEDERIAADIGRNIGLGAEITVGADEQVLAGTQRHDGDRLLVLSDEDDRIRQGGRGELGHHHRYQIGLGHKTVGLVDGVDAEVAVGFQGQRLGLRIEQDITRQGGGGSGIGHGRDRTLKLGKRASSLLVL